MVVFAVSRHDLQDLYFPHDVAMCEGVAIEFDSAHIHVVLLKVVSRSRFSPRVQCGSVNDLERTCIRLAKCLFNSNTPAADPPGTVTTAIERGSLVKLECYGPGMAFRRLVMRGSVSGYGQICDPWWPSGFLVM